MLEPLHRVAHGYRLEAAIDGATLLFAHHQARLCKDIHVLQHAGKRHGEGLRQLADGQLVALRKTLHDPPPGRIGQRQERRIEAVIKVYH